MSALHSADRAEPNLVPILDMVFQLITFFMLVINFKAAETDTSLKLPVADPPVVRGLKLRSLRLWKAERIQDLSPVAGMPLEIVELAGTGVKDLRPLLACLTLRELVLPSQADAVASLRKLPNLQRLSYEPDRGSPKSW